MSRSESRAGTDFGRMSGRLSADIFRYMATHRSRRNVSVQIIAVVRLPSGRLRSYEALSTFSQADGQNLSKKGYKNFVMRKMYALIAGQLKKDGYVTAQSRNHIRRLNKWKKKALWNQARHRKGRVRLERWEKNEHETVKILKLSYSVDEIRTLVNVEDDEEEPF